MAVKESLKFNVHLVPEIAKKVTSTTDGEQTIKIKMELCESGAFSYGNGTCTIMRFENFEPPYETERVYDTRYTSVKDFRKLSTDLIADYYGENLDYIEEVES